MLHRSPLFLALVLALIATSCSDDTETEASPTSTTPETTTTTSAPETTTSTTTPPPIVGGEAGDADVEALQAFLASGPADEPFYMVNLIRYREHAEYVDGRETDLTGEEADAIYGEFMRNTKLPEIGAEIVYSAVVEQDLIGGTQFDRVGVVRYPSRTAFQAMITSADFQEMNVHKQAGVADTVVMATNLLVAPDLPVLETYPYPATEDDAPFAFVHVLDYRDTAVYAAGDENADDTRSGRDAVDLYSNNAGAVALPLGVRALAWFEVEQTIIGPADTWDEVRINWFPSHAAFEVLTSDPQWESGAHHRTAGLAETYAIMTAPEINTFG
ncbi:MAG: hypothetical protein R8F63_05810 [Acidimicrobiales bacterium]|nr:hypothetical protein [Acidimicrobiales bacterium]